MTDETTLESALADAFDQLLLDVHTALPGRVESYDLATQTADVKPMVKLDGESLPVLPAVPVAFPRGGGGFLSFPMQAGDFVFLLFAESSIDQWRAKGAETAPGDVRRHSLTAAVALPCLYPSARALADAHASQVALGVDGGKSVQVSSSQVMLGSAAPIDAVALASKVDSFQTALDLFFRSLVGATPLTPSALAALWIATFTLPPASVASTVVKAD